MWPELARLVDSKNDAVEIKFNETWLFLGSIRAPQTKTDCTELVCLHNKACHRWKLGLENLPNAADKYQLKCVAMMLRWPLLSHGAGAPYLTVSPLCVSLTFDKIDRLRVVTHSFWLTDQLIPSLFFNSPHSSFSVFSSPPVAQ